MRLWGDAGELARRRKRDPGAWAVLIVSVGLAGVAAAAEIVGGASVVDGDTLEIHGERVRLAGIDAPESAQTCQASGRAWRCGQQAALALDDWIGDRVVRCAVSGHDRYGRAVATCRAGGQDMNAWLVRSGWALDWPRYSDGAYAGEQAAAKAAGAGIWRGSFTKPWVWRRR